MCTIILAHRYLDGTPIGIGANREEAYDRPSRGPHAFDTSPAVFGPQDLLAEGSWLAINRDGPLIAAVTNRAGGEDGERSRGLLLRDIARESAVTDAAGLARDELASRGYAGCNILIADAEDAIVLQWGTTLTERSLSPGFHVIVNEGIDQEHAKSATVRARVQSAAPRSVPRWKRRVESVLADHAIGACRHGADRGTRSSSIVTWGATDGWRWAYAEGHPCQTKYREVNVDDGESPGPDSGLE